MKLCKKCFREFDEGEEEDYSPARDLGDILSDSGNEDCKALLSLRNKEKRKNGPRNQF